MNSTTQTISKSTVKISPVSKVSRTIALFVVTLISCMGIFSPETLKANVGKISKTTGVALDDLNGLTQYLENKSGYTNTSMLPLEIEALGYASFWTIVYGCVNVRSFGFAKVLETISKLFGVPFRFVSVLTGMPITTPITVAPVISLISGIYTKMLNWVNAGNIVNLSKSVDTVVEKYPYFSEVKAELIPTNLLIFISELRNSICVLAHSETVEFIGEGTVSEN